METVQWQHAPQFIHKILKMIEKYPHSINWSQDGIDLFILKQNHFTKIVLPQFFRHDNLGSFIRQLNIYGFSKISWDKKILKFRHQFFKRDEEQYYHKIIRKKKQNTQKKCIILSKEEQIKIHLRQNFNGSLSELPSLFNILFRFRNNYEYELRQVKKKIDHLNREINPRNVKKLKPLIATIKEHISRSMQQIKKADQKIEEFDLNQAVSNRQQVQIFNQNKTEDNALRLEIDYENNLEKLETYNIPVQRQIKYIQHNETMASQLSLQQNPNCKYEDRISTKIIEFQSISKFIFTG